MNEIHIETASEEEMDCFALNHWGPNALDPHMVAALKATTRCGLVVYAVISAAPATDGSIAIFGDKEDVADDRDLINCLQGFTDMVAYQHGIDRYSVRMLSDACITNRFAKFREHSDFYFESEGASP